MLVASTRSWIRDLAPLFALAVSGAISCSGQVDDGAPGADEPGSAGGNGPHEDGMRRRKPRMQIDAESTFLKVLGW